MVRGRLTPMAGPTTRGPSLGTGGMKEGAHERQELSKTTVPNSNQQDLQQHTAVRSTLGQGWCGWEAQKHDTTSLQHHTLNSQLAFSLLIHDGSWCALGNGGRQCIHVTLPTNYKRCHYSYVALSHGLGHHQCVKAVGSQSWDQETPWIQS